jgi:Transposase DDE domain group 1
MSIPPAWPQVLNFFGTPLVLEPSPGKLTSDAGLLPVRQFDQRIGLPRAFAGALDDPLHPDLTGHRLLGRARARANGLRAGYVGQNAYDSLRAGPVVKRLADRPPDGGDLARPPPPASNSTARGMNNPD